MISTIEEKLKPERELRSSERFRFQPRCSNRNQIYLPLKTTKNLDKVNATMVSKSLVMKDSES